MTSKIESVVAALARSVVYHGAAQPEDTQLVSKWLDELKNADDDATDDAADDATDDKTFKPAVKKTK